VVCINKTIISQGPPNEVLTSENLLKTYGLATDINSLGGNKDSLSISNTLDAHNRGLDTNQEPE
jgi:ABC-type cobalamin/Fe3+-siderophores transport system ATPase subunit